MGKCGNNTTKKKLVLSLSIVENDVVIRTANKEFIPFWKELIDDAEVLTPLGSDAENVLIDVVAKEIANVDDVKHMLRELVS